MLLLRLVARALALVLVSSAGLGYSQAYPNKPIRIVTSAAGGGADFTARLVALGISGPLGQQVIVDNRTGLLAADIVSKAPSDGYTLIINGASLWITPLLQAVPYDAINDFAPVSLVSMEPSVLVVQPSLATSVKELIAVAKAKPGALNYASSGIGSAAASGDGTIQVHGGHQYRAYPLQRRGTFCGSDARRRSAGEDR